MGENNGFLKIIIIIFMVISLAPMVIAFRTVFPNVTLNPFAIVLISIGFIKIDKIFDLISNCDFWNVEVLIIFS